MEARNIFWQKFAEMEYYCFYLREIRKSLLAFNRVVDIVVTLFSSASIAAWTIWNVYPRIWAALVISAQILSIVKPILHIFEKTERIGLCLPDLEAIACQMERTWLFIDKLSECEILEKCSEFDEKSTQIITKYIEPLALRDSKKAQVEAATKRDLYLKTYTICYEHQDTLEVS